MTRPRFLVSAIVIVGIGAAAPAHAGSDLPGCSEPTPARGTYHRLTFPGTIEIVPSAINDKETIVGSLRDADDQAVHGFVYRHGRLRLIDVPGSSTTNAKDINDAGTIVGRFDGHGFILRRGALTTIDAPGSFATSVQAVNNSNVIGGLGLEPNDSDGLNVGFVRSPDGSFERIVPPGSDSSLVADVDDRGTLLVNASFGQVLRIDGQYEPIQPCHPLDFVERLATVSKHLAFVGATTDAANMERGMLRTNTRFETFLYPGSIDTVLLDVNDQGTAIGIAIVPDVGQIAFVFVPRKQR
ncbi:MAG TPA: hypothetical protein VH417_02745 [Vicinamibacterales bacterium]